MVEVATRKIVRYLYGRCGQIAYSRPVLYEGSVPEILLGAVVWYRGRCLGMEFTLDYSAQTNTRLPTPVPTNTSPEQ